MTTDKPELDLEAIEALRILAEETEYAWAGSRLAGNTVVKVPTDQFQALVAHAEDLRRERDVLAGVVAGVREVADDWDCHPNAESMHDALIQALSAGGGAE